MNRDFLDELKDALDESPLEGEVVDSSDEEAEEMGHDLNDLLMKMLSHGSGLFDDPDDGEEDDEDDEDDEYDLSGMDADDIHNKAVDYARHDKWDKATEICRKGLEIFPKNADLLADTITYSVDSGDMKTAAEYYDRLKQVLPFRCWNWRAFTFSLDYLIKADPIENEDECRTIIANFRKYLPYDERAAKAESEMESLLGNSERSYSVLAEAVAAHSNASVCALILADKQMERGLYEEVIDTANYGIAASARPQSSINVPYLLFLRTLAGDHLLHRKVFLKETVSAEEVERIKQAYEKLVNQYKAALRNNLSCIRNRIELLSFIDTE